MRRFTQILLITICLLPFIPLEAQSTMPDVLDLIHAAAEQHAQELDLRGMELDQLPPEIGQIETLVRLNLAGNHLTTLPPEIGELGHLQELRLNDNPITYLPDEIGWLGNLRHLDLTNTQVTELPSSLWTLPELRVLHLRRVPLGELPDDIGRLTHLVHLDLRDMGLAQLPDSLRRLRQLHILDLGGNAFDQVPQVVFSLQKLQALYLHFTPLMELSPEIDQLAALRLLDLRNTALTELPPEVGSLTELHSLLIENTQISTLPIEIGFLDHLVNLWTYNSGLPYDVTEQQTLPDLHALQSTMRTEAIESGRVPPPKQLYISSYPEAPVMQYGYAPPSPPEYVPSDIYFEDYGENPIVNASEDNLSTFAMDVDTASYTLARSYLLDFNQLPPPEAVRAEEFINFFPIDYPKPENEAFHIHMDAAQSPFRKAHRLMLRVGIQGLEVPPDQRDPVLLIFVIDISGSMSGEERLGRVKESLDILVKSLRPDDRVGIVVYADQPRVVLEPISAAEQDRILEAIHSLNTEGSTYAEAGLRLGYDLAAQYRQEGEITRIMLLSDGVANVGATGPDAILETISDGVSGGITLSTVGFGMGNFNDVLMEQLANQGNGNYFYVDNLREARRIFGSSLTSTLQVIAYDARIQVDFNPDVVKTYRLIGYENRAIADEDFRDDDVDAGEVGAGHSVTALYEIELVDENQAFFDSPPAEIQYLTQFGVTALAAIILAGFYLIFRARRPKHKRKVTIHAALLLSFILLLWFPIQAQKDDRVATTTIRYEEPENRASLEVSANFYLADVYTSIDDAPADFRLLLSVAEFAELLGENPHIGDGHYGEVLRLLHPLRGATEAVTELIDIVEKAQSLIAR